MKNLAVGIDFTPAREPVLECASGLAYALHAKLHVAHIVAPEPAFVGYTEYTYPGIDERREELEQEKDQLQAVVDRLLAESIDARGYMQVGPTAQGLIDFATEHEAEMIIVGTHGRNPLTRILLGTTAEGLLRQSEIPILLVPIRKE